MYIRFLISINLIAISIKSTSGCSYITHIILAASIAEPPPIAMIQSGSKLLIALVPSIAHCNVGSGATLKKVVCVMPSSSSLSVTHLV